MLYEGDGDEKNANRLTRRSLLGTGERASSSGGKRGGLEGFDTSMIRTAFRLICTCVLFSTSFHSFL